MENKAFSINQGSDVNNCSNKKLKDGGIIIGTPEITRLKTTPKQNSLPISIESVNPQWDNLEDRKLANFRNTVSEPNIFVTPAVSEDASSEHIIVFPKGADVLSPVNHLYGTYKKKVS